MKTSLRPGSWSVRILLCVCIAGLLAAGAVKPAPQYPKLLTDTLGYAVQNLHPADFSVEDNGVRAQVVGYLSDGSEARIYLTLKDLRRDRILGEDLHLLTERHYGDPTARESAITNQSVLGYDETSGTVLLELKYAERSSENRTSPPESGKVLDARLPVIGVYAGFAQARFDTGITLAEIQARKPALLDNPDPEGFALAFGGYEKSFPDVPWMKISNIGIWGNQCRILTVPTTPEGIFGSQHFYFEGETGDMLTTESYITQDGAEFDRLLREPAPSSEPDRMEIRMEIPAGDPAHIRLVLSSSASQHFIEGDWMLEFPMESTDKLKLLSRPVSVTGENGDIFNVEQVYITPFKTVVYGSYQQADAKSENFDLPDFNLLKKNGGPDFANATQTTFDAGRFSAEILFDVPRKLEEITAVRFGDAEISVA